MKVFKHIVAAVAALSLFTSCGILGGSGLSTGTTASTGSTTGTALATIFNVLKNTGALDLGNLTNLINLGQILTGANSLVDATKSYTDQYAANLLQRESGHRRAQETGGDGHIGPHQSHIGRLCRQSGSRLVL